MEDPTPLPGDPVSVSQQRHDSDVSVSGYSSAESSPVESKSANASVLDSLPHLQNLQQKVNKLDYDNLSAKISDGELESLLSPEASPADNIEDWKRRLTSLVQNNDKQELISKEKKDRRDFEEIAALASKMGLYSHVYAKASVISKVPLPHYRFDLDDRRPKREVILPPALLKRVEAHLKEYLSHKPRFTEGFIDKSFPGSSRSCSTSIDEGILEKSEPSPFLEKILMKRNLQLQEQRQDWQESPEGKAMLKLRRNLPAYKEKDPLLKAISKNQVVIISGHTGCGKTTQIPQFILESEIELGRGALCNILCTQPRRISAISVSERVASERGEKLGESVGYKVWMEGVKGPDTRLLFCTTGVLLRRLLVDRDLKNVTHIIVDEIHERGINEDFLLIVLKELLTRRSDLRVILMSATLDAELFSSYFAGAPIIPISGFTHPVRTHFLEDILKTTGYRLTPFNQVDDYGQEKTWKASKQAPKKRKSRISSAVEGPLGAADFGSYSPCVRDSLTCWDPESIGFNLIEHVLSHICERERQGAVLVFMIGWEDIRCLKDKLQAHPILGDQKRVLLLACHGSMASAEQRLIFGKAAHGVRKIVLATNIAETSITINDVVFVVDCGKAKETSYDALNNTPCLLPSWISKASVQQRRGRAGRVQPGECYHLYPKCVYEGFAEYQLPEILRIPLQSLCLQIKSLELGSISEFLSRALQSPDSLAVQNAVHYLKLIGALDENEKLTVLGSYLAMLPVEPKLGKMLVLGAIFNCLNPILTVVAGLTARDPFLTPSDNKDSAEAAKSQFACDYSDHLALARAYEGWKDAEVNFAEHEYCCKNFLSLQSMKAIDSLREELFSLLSEAGLVDSNSTTNSVWSYDEHLLRAVICSGLYPGVCSVMNTEKSFSLRTMEDGQVVLHGSSVNAHEASIPYPWLVFNERVKMKCVFIHDSTAVSDSVLLLFGGSILKGDTDGHIKMLEGYLEFFMDPSMVEMFQTVRLEINEIIQNKLQYPWMDINCYHELLSATRLLLAEYRGSGRFFHGPTPPKPLLSVPKTQTGPGPVVDNPKGELQTLLARKRKGLPTYKVTNVGTNMFLATVEFSGVHVTGQPCPTKKAAEKDAAAAALKWISGWKSKQIRHEERKLTKKRKTDNDWYM